MPPTPFTGVPKSNAQLSALPASAKQRGLRGHQLAIWLLAGLLLGLLGCSGLPGEKLTFSPGKCDPQKELIENDHYIPSTVKLPPGPNKYASLFSEGFVYGCLIGQWEWDTPDKQPPASQRSDELTDHFALIRLLPTGKMQAVEPLEGSDQPVLTFPKGPIHNASMVLYIVPNRLTTDRTGFKDLCRQMQQSSFACFAKENAERCVFYFRLSPKTNPPTALKLKEGQPSCLLCAPEVCDGKDNDCDGQVDNFFGTALPLVQPCYTGDKKTLLSETQGIGICHAGEQLCNAGKWDVCTNQQTPKAAEECNNKDDNCNGKIDEGGEGELCPIGETCQAGKCAISSCRKGETSCGKICADLGTDRAHCGTCNNPCRSGEACVAGKCVVSCPSETPTACPATPGGNERLCVNTKLDRNHCGACGKLCENGGICFEGKCVLSCPASAPHCGTGPSSTCCSLNCCKDQCLDLRTNPQHCGSCGNQCPSGNLCFQGACRIECPSFAPKCGPKSRELCCDHACCNESCVDTTKDRDNCGACGVKCKDGELCYEGNCLLNCPQKAPACGKPEDKTCCSLDCCNDACVDTSNDRNHCGACGTPCKPGEICNGGICVLSCPNSAPKCGIGSDETCCALSCCSNACVDVQNDPKHCGSCNKLCPRGQVCQKGTCTFVCPPTQSLCGSKCIDVSVNPNHCGGCNQKCGAGERCENSQCLLCPNSAPTCGTGAQRTCCSLNCCQASGGNSSCIDTQNNPEHCGGCGNACKPGERCLKGACQLCPSQAPKCGSSCCSNSCCNNTCVETSYHPLHCGGCGKVCTNGQTCCNGKCIDLQRDKDNCGKCGTKCSGTKVCSQGICCNRGEAACGNLCINLKTNQNNCGACGNACGTGQTCVNGQCNCPGNATRCGNDCVNIDNDTSHCGACGKACHAGQSCQSRNCTCPTNETSCANTCVNLTTNITHCGVCNNPCTGGRTCQSGQCLCPTGSTQCGANCVDIQSDANHCGGCSNPCAMGQICCGAGCVDPLTSNIHCGGCNAPCPAGQSCQNGTCQ